ncbi:hypothetical protein G4W71_06280 [Clostridium botulinum]|uniref:YmaF family protein n=1 Tax=Clostridium botulinum TaxID=1491 RepID=UPI0007DFDB7D|nr:YmaF family protein [Clostridium botulinum]KEI98324.1 hypothetical protein N497_10990 [Clostridium botulinum F 357]MBE1303640.1 hypothetical protein [Clostridium botulinum]
MSHCKEMQTHVHEFLDSTRLAQIQTEPHDHHFAGVSGQAIRSSSSHECIFATLIDSPIFQEA